MPGSTLSTSHEIAHLYSSKFYEIESIIISYEQLRHGNVKLFNQSKQVGQPLNWSSDPIREREKDRETDRQTDKGKDRQILHNNIELLRKWLVAREDTYRIICFPKRFSSLATDEGSFFPLK